MREIHSRVLSLTTLPHGSWAQVSSTQSPDLHIGSAQASEKGRPTRRARKTLGQRGAHCRGTSLRHRCTDRVRPCSRWGGSESGLCGTVRRPRRRGVALRDAEGGEALLLVRAFDKQPMKSISSSMGADARSDTLFLLENLHDDLGDLVAASNDFGHLLVVVEGTRVLIDEVAGLVGELQSLEATAA